MILYPFYGRIYDVFCKMPANPWFKGEESSAKKGNAVILIMIHQFLVINFIYSMFRIYDKKMPQMNIYVGVVLGIFLAIVNYSILLKRNETRNISSADWFSVGIFVVTMLVLASSIVFFRSQLHGIST